MTRLKTSLICTVLNEENTIADFIDSVASQSILPLELIIIDGGSIDKTLEKVNEKIKQYKKRLSIKVFIKKGNRSIGRNEGVKRSAGEIILCSDSGNLLEKNWIKNITNPFSDKSVEVVAGYYKGKAKTLFQRCLIPYVLVMPNKVDANNFLPATRSMAFKKSVWKRVGGFDERLSHNEDYAFANKLKDRNAKIVFTKEAIVEWIPRKNLFQAFKMFFRFALGDIQSGILRDKVILLFARYILFFYFIFLSLAYRSIFLLYALGAGVIFYLAWAILKQYRYVNNYKSIFVLPLIQLTADASVIAGSIFGTVDNLFRIKYKRIINSHKSLSIIIVFYSLIVLSTINWGIPSVNHPFTYGMDEWHSLQSLKSVITHGTTSIEGAANGPIFFYFLTGLYLIPFILLGLINPLSIKSSVENLALQHQLFEILRLSTLLWGILSIILIYKLLKDFISKSPLVGTLFFVASPIFILLSNYFKYDPAVTFWITFSIFSILSYKKTQSLKNLIISAVVCALAISVKVSALPLFPVFIISFFIFTDKPFKKLFNLFVSTFIFIFTFLIFGIPDILFKTSAYAFYFSENLVRIPQSVFNLNLGTSWWKYIWIKEFPSIFGYITTILFYTSLIYLIISVLTSFFSKKKQVRKVELFLVVVIILFIASLIPLKITGGGSRALVLTPLIVIAISIFYTKISSVFKNYKQIIKIVLFLGFMLQIIQTCSWVYLKWQVNPQESSSAWIISNIKKGSLIGLENIPIYQNIPDIALKEFYFNEYKVKNYNYYSYKIVYPGKYNFPKIIVVTNSDIQNYFKSSPTKDLLNDLNKRDYRMIKKFSPDFRFYNVFNDKAYLIFGNLVQIPSDISIFQR